MWIICALLVTLITTTPAFADTWDVTYYLRSPVVGSGPLASPGTYQLLLGPDYVPVYVLRAEVGWQFIGLYSGSVPGVPQDNYPAQLPAGFPVISFPLGTDAALAVDPPVVATPELHIKALSTGLGRYIAPLVVPTLQRWTAAGATQLLRAVGLPAIRRGVFIALPTVTLEVEPWCSGLQAIKWEGLFALGVMLCLAARQGLSLGLLVLLAVAPFVAIETNMLRVAAIGVAFSHGYGWPIKEPIALATLAAGLLQLGGVSVLVSRRGRHG